MLIFLDESFRRNVNSSTEYGVLAGVAIPEDIYHEFQLDFYGVRKPYHGLVLKEDDEVHGKELLNKATLKRMRIRGSSSHWSLAEDLLNFSRSRKIKVFGVVCFRPCIKSFVCADETQLDLTFRYLFERIDTYMKREFPERIAKLVFDNREHTTHEANARAITNFFVKSAIGKGYDSILRIPLFAVSQGHNYGLQLADLVTTVIALNFQGRREFRPLWNTVKRMFYVSDVGGNQQTSLKVMRNTPGIPWSA
ncbi:MAG: DUF3800 domain-containing protein [Pirellulales bacterium]|nr:DUF3800 domain-containing protein [Pirellulales bacterium]